MANEGPIGVLKAKPSSTHQRNGETYAEPALIVELAPEGAPRERAP